MKYVLVLIFAMLSMPAMAGGYYNPSIDTYDPETGLYYKSVEIEKSSGFLSSGGHVMVNLYIYNPATGEGRYLFPNKEGFQIVALTFETAVKDGKVEFNSDYSSPIKNNTNIDNRKPKSTLLILTRDVNTHTETFYFAQKDGSKLERAKSILKSDDWHIDVKNSVIRIIKQTGLEIKMESFPW